MPILFCVWLLFANTPEQLTKGTILQRFGFLAFSRLFCLARRRAVNLAFHCVVTEENAKWVSVRYQHTDPTQIFQCLYKGRSNVVVMGFISSPLLNSQNMSESYHISLKQCPATVLE